MWNSLMCVCRIFFNKILFKGYSHSLLADSHFKFLLTPFSLLIIGPSVGFNILYFLTHLHLLILVFCVEDCFYCRNIAVLVSVTDGLVLLRCKSLWCFGKIRSKSWILGRQAWSMCWGVPDDHCRPRVQVSTSAAVIFHFENIWPHFY